MSDNRKNSQQQAKSSKIILSNKGLKDSDNIFSELMSLSEVTEIDLSGNNLTTLPKDLSGLKKLQSLDVTNNPFNNVFFIKLVRSSCLGIVKLTRIDRFEN
jgi:Leucine-rich repeat (LRR) protein